MMGDFTVIISLNFNTFLTFLFAWKKVKEVTDRPMSIEETKLRVI